MYTDVTSNERATRTLQDATQTLLTRFAVAFNRRLSYRPSHPMVVRAEAQLLESLMHVMSLVSDLTLNISPRELRWGGQKMRSRQAVNREVAARLHRRGVSSLVFQQGITPESLTSLLSWLAPQLGRSSTSNDLGKGPELSGFVLGRIPYDRLVMTDSVEANEEQINALWFALASVALGGTSTDDTHSNATPLHVALPSTVADAIRNGTRNPEYARRIAEVLFTLVDQATHATSNQRAAIGQRLKDIVPLLDAKTVLAILEHVGDDEQQRAFMTQVTDALPTNAVVGWLETAAQSTGRSLSHQLLRLLTKLAKLTDGQNVGSSVETNFRDAAQDLVSGWDLDETNPEEHIELLDQIASIESDRTSNLNAKSPVELELEQHGEPARLVQMALEIGVAGEETIAAMSQLTINGRTADALAWIAHAEPSHASDMLKAAAASPTALRIVLLSDAPDVNAARLLMPAVAEEGIPALLDVLASSSVRIIRRVVLDRIREFGPAAWTQLLQRLDDTTWFFARNILVLMREIRVNEREAGRDIATLPIVGVARYLSHEREQLRLEAVRLLLDDPTMRDSVLRRALDDAHPRVLREGLEWLIAVGNSTGNAPSHAVPADFIPRLIALIDSQALPDEIRARAVWALDVHPNSQVLEWLIAHASRRRWLSRKRTVAPASPTVLAAIGLLAKRYATEPRAAALLSKARAIRDLRGQAAGGTTPPFESQP